MKNLIFIILFISTFSFTSGQDRNTNILRRADSWFGLHFDLHASEDTENAGETLTEEMITDLLRRVKPDYVQIDCKGHGGISSYPTKVGYPLKGFIKDPIELWRKVTNDQNIGLYVHFSGVYDKKIVNTYPDYAVLNPDKIRDTKMTSVFGPYSDKYLIPQLKELSKKYGIDGAWIDGECWAVKPDYDPEVLKLFTKETGIGSIPVNPDDKGYTEFLDFQRKHFIRYLQHYVNAIHEFDPDFQVTSNWAFSSMMPVEVNVNLDYLSGDLQPFNAVYSAAFESRCLASQGKPWDLMAWSFNWSPERKDVQFSTKSPQQLMQETAQVISSGGGIQFYFRQNQDLSIQPWTIGIMEALSKFCMERKPYCENAKQVKEIGILYSGNSFLRSLSTMYAPGWSAPELNSLKGILNATLDNQYQADILMDHHVSNQIHDYKLIIVPEWDHLPTEVVANLKEYVQKGGKLMLIGTSTIETFSDVIEVAELTEKKTNRIYIENEERLADINSSWLSAKVHEEFITDYFYDINDLRYSSAFPSASFNKFGKGSVAAVYFDLGTVYNHGRNPVIRDFFNKLIKSQLPDPLVSITGTKLVHAVATRKNNKLFINLINMAGDHANVNVFSFDEIPPLGSFKLLLKLEQKPLDIYLQPQNTKLDFTWNKGIVSLQIPHLHIHDIIEVRSN